MIENGRAPLNIIRPDRALGGAIDGLPAGQVESLFTTHNVAAIRGAGLRPISYSLRTELGIDAWHWGEEGSWSDSVHHQGYWTSSDNPKRPVMTGWGYKLPRRGDSVDQAEDDGYSRLDDGDSNSFWKSDPYLDTRLSHSEDRPQWVIADFGRPFRASITRLDSKGDGASANPAHGTETINISSEWLPIYPGTIDDEELRLVEGVASGMAGLPAFDWRTLSMLIDRHTISYAPSATVAGLLKLATDARSGLQPYSGTLLAFGDPTTDGLFFYAGGQQVALPPLPNSRQEVTFVAETIAKAIPPVSYETRIELWTGAHATKARAIVEMLNPPSFRFLHFALHGNLTSRDPELSSLVFAPDPQDGDPFLSALEISTDDIDAELVVLSACDTGLGRIQTGEGVLGLARAFLSAGALTVCAASWSLEDRSTSMIMPRFYRNFLHGANKAEALREAQVWLRNARSDDLAGEPLKGHAEPIGERVDDRVLHETIVPHVNSGSAPYAHPFFWAGFVLHGA